MNSPSLSEIHNLLNKNTKFDSKLNIVILRNIVLEPFDVYLKYQASKINHHLEIKMGEYDNILREVVEGTLIKDENINAILIFVKLETLSPSICNSFCSLSQENLNSEIERIQNFITLVINSIRSHSKSMIIWHGFENLNWPSYGVIDHQLPNGQSGVINNLNDYLCKAMSQIQDAFFIDLNKCLLNLGIKQYYDLRYWSIAKAPYRREALSFIANEEFKFIKAKNGLNKKCLILDCDNVLWGGIIGEDGIDGIIISNSHPGSSFIEFQQEVVNLYNRGVIIALCSKNNEKDVWEVFEKHPSMILNKDHITISRINWNDKASSIQEIASELNIGLDSIVFMDDSDFEIDSVRKCLPMIESIQLHQKKALEHKNILSSCGLFDSLYTTEEDKKRSKMYLDDNKRKKIFEKSLSMNDYYMLLEMIPEIKFLDKISIPRVAQIMQKTNQFNLTTKRYNAEEISQLGESKSSDVLYLCLKDKFGDSGLVGVCILKYDFPIMNIDSFLLSCRVLGKKVEEVFLNQVILLAKKNRCERIIAKYIPTKKNIQTENFYSSNGFDSVKTPDKSKEKKYEFLVRNYTALKLDFFKKINSEIMLIGK
jgi:FkbH-like protein